MKNIPMSLHHPRIPIGHDKKYIHNNRMQLQVLSIESMALFSVNGKHPPFTLLLCGQYQTNLAHTSDVLCTVVSAATAAV